jgi:pullulanase
MNLISDELHKIRPDIILYGEGWTAGESTLPDSLRALKQNAYKLHNIAVFSDDLRDGIKGTVFDIKDRGFATGKPSMEESVKFGIVAAGAHPQVDYSKVNYSKKPYTIAPWNVISYCECHDNNTLWDKISLSCPDVSEPDRKKMHQLALTIVLTSQGIPFLHAGTEFLRSKKGVENSYKSSDSINAIDWNLKKENLALNNYIEELIWMRKQHPAFRMTTSSQVKQYIHFDESAPPGTVVYFINGTAVNDKWRKIWIAFNGSDADKDVNLPVGAGQWKNGLNTDANPIMYVGHMLLKKYSAVILFQE